MLRFLCALFHISYETCLSCETLKSQLILANEEKKQLTETLIDILKPKVVESGPITLTATEPIGLSFMARRAAAEARDRETAKALRESKNIAKSDETIKKLETELDISQEKEN